jgi:hypothetical protein
MIHIVFGESDIKVLAQAIELDESLQGDIIQIKDDYAVGPIEALDTPEGWQARLQFWKELVAGSPYAPQLENLMMIDDRMTAHNLVKRLEEDEKETVWIWMGQNGHDVTGYYWLIPQLRDFQGRVFVLYLNNLPFINEKGAIFYPSYLHQIQPKEFLKAKKLCRKVTLSEFEVDPDEWKRLASENGGTRILEGGKKIVSKEADFYDKDILAGLSKDFQKGQKAIGNILSKMKIPTGDTFLIGRMRVLQEQELIEMAGDPSKGWKDFEVRLKSAQAETVTTEDQTTAS